MKYNGVIQRKLALLDDHVQELTRYLAKIHYEQFESERFLQLATERSIQICAEVVIDVAERIIAIENAGPVATAADAIRRLEQLGVIRTSQTYVEIVRFRNLIVHEYERIDPRLLYDIAKNRLSDFTAFRDEIDASDPLQ